MALSVEHFTLSDYQSNCYVVRADENASDAAVIDPGGDPSALLAALSQRGVETAGILVTHTDIDHVDGVAALASASGAEVWAPAGELEALRTGQTRTGNQFRAHDPEHAVQAGDEITVAGITFAVVDVAGHSAGHVAFVAGDAIFSGDLLFAGSVGRVDLPGGDWETLLDSVNRLVAQFGRDAVVYPGHGPKTTLGQELDTNPFLGELRSAAQ
jgi:glyoxylase-like metal-dependent hydrolase (beta-lactamase superfamily II)